MKNTQTGFGLLAIIITIAVLAALGGGVYYSQHKAALKSDTEVNGDVESDGDTDNDDSTEVDVGVKSGTLRALLSMDGNVMCTVSSSANGTTSTGTVYVSGSSMHGDFTSTTSSSGAIESHMTKKDDMMYLWSGSSGAKLDIDDMDATTSAQTHVDIDQSVSYSCKPWTVDTSKFTLPTTITFVDLSAMLNATGGITLPH